MSSVASTVLLAYTVGKPVLVVEPDRLDAQEWEHFKDAGKIVRELPDIIHAPEPALAINAMRAIRPANTAQLFEELRESVLADLAQGSKEPPSANGRDGERTRKRSSTNGHDGAGAPNPTPNPEFLRWFEENLLAAESGEQQPAGAPVG